VSRVWWQVVLVLAITGWVLVPDECRAQAKCPWLNAATAAGLLGGEVQMTVTAPVDPGPVKGAGTAMYPDQVRMDRFDVSCQFSRKLDSGMSALSIAVNTMSDPAKDFVSFLAHCDGEKLALKGVGNEAVQCLRSGDSGNGREQVMGRVRDRTFVITVNRSAPAAPAEPGVALQSDTRNIAEQVAGSLF
jgi:hypothetical protein